MNIHWETVIKPLFDALEPKNIVEIGSEDGDNTQKILEYCDKTGAVLYAIDPVPNFDVETWQKKYGEKFVFHRSLSLNALPLVKEMDIVLIDGDHNWYTVYNELKLIENLSLKNQSNFPMIVLHDVGWPYARRDLYYNPDNIPPAYLKPYKKKGIYLDSPELAENGGFNDNLFNSIYENTLQNGVLTAVEDFLAETELPLELVTVPAYHGLGFLFPQDYKGNSDFKAFIEGIAASRHLIELMEQLERSRIDQIFKIKNINANCRQIENRHSLDVQRYKKKLSDMQVESQAAINRYKQKLQDLEEVRQATVASYSKKISLKDQELSRYKKKVRQQEKNIAQLRDWIVELNKGFAVLTASRRYRIGNLIVNLIRRLTFRKKGPADVEHMARVFNRFKAWKQKRKAGGSVENNYTADDLEQLRHLFEALKKNLEMLLHSKRWKLGNFAGTVIAIPLGKGKKAPEAENIINILADYSQWKPEPGRQSEDYEQLKLWVEQLEKNYKLLLATRRWKIGNKIVTLSNRLTLKKQENPVPKAIHKLFDQYHKQKKKAIKDQKVKAEKVNQEESVPNFYLTVTAEEALGEPYRRR